VSAAPQGPPPPPSSGGAASGSPFGRFPTQFLGLIAVLVAGVAAVSFSMSGDGGNSASPPKPTSLAGTWQGQAALVGGDDALVRLEIRDDGTGTLRRAGCAGRLTPAQTMSGTALFDYSSAERGCPRRTQVSVTSVDADTLRLEERRLNGRPLLDATLERR
jgi:hypothetical protein